jgi:hypothetical protein
MERIEQPDQPGGASVELRLLMAEETGRSARARRELERLLVDLEGELRRGILMVKLRGQAHDRTIHEYQITDDGIRILGPFHGVAGIVAGRASFLGCAHATRPAGRGEGEPGRV